MPVGLKLSGESGNAHAVGQPFKNVLLPRFVEPRRSAKDFSFRFCPFEAGLFLGWLFRPYLPADQIDSYIAGLIILAAAPCTAMVFVWSNLTKGEPHFTLSQVALNDAIMVVSFAPIVGLLLGLSVITVPWGTLVLSVVLYIAIPAVIAQLKSVTIRRRSRSQTIVP